MTNAISAANELPADNAARIAIYDALSEAPLLEGLSRPALAEEELFARVIGRLRILVPRELHVQGERAYVREKIDACVNEGIVERVAWARDLLTLTDLRPRIRYPDRQIHEYDAGLEAARERLESDDAKLRRRPLDVNKLVPSLADDARSEDFQALVDSMREHGYLKQFPVLHGNNGEVVDGRARVAAAAIANVNVAYDQIPQRRDTPLHRLLLAIDANYGRLSQEDRERVYAEVERHTDRRWPDIAADLALTRAWRRAAPRPYSTLFEVKKVRYRPTDRPNVQITRDGKVMLRSLLEAAGLSNYKIKDLQEYIVEERARTAYSAGRRAIFVGIDDAIAGIREMQRERRERNLSVDKEWEEIRRWLINLSADTPKTDAPGEPSVPSDGGVEAAQQQLV